MLSPLSSNPRASAELSVLGIQSLGVIRNKELRALTDFVTTDALSQKYIHMTLEHESQLYTPSTQSFYLQPPYTAVMSPIPNYADFG